VPFEPVDEVVVRAAVPDERGGLTRRQFLTLMGAGGAAVGIMSQGQLLRHARRVAVLTTDAAPPVGLPPAGWDLFIAAERDVDLVMLDFFFYGFAVQPGSPPAITPTRTDNKVLVRFPPQAIGEAVYSMVDSSGKLLVDVPPILSDVAGPTRLVFSLGPSQSIPLPTMTATDLLDWSHWNLAVPPVASVDTIDRVQSPFQVAAPGALQTQIECPYALYLSPTDLGAFTSRHEPLTIDDSGFHDVVTDCWGTVLDGDARVVATYARDYPGAAVSDATAANHINYQPPQPK
jgi:hypothetical protein